MDAIAQAPDAGWTWVPAAMIALPAYLVVYARRWRRVRARERGGGAETWRLLACAAGLVALAVALVSPVARLGEQMFIWHMTQHILLLDVAPILLIAGLSEVLLRPVGARLRAVEERAGPLGHWATAMFLYAGTLWAWHLPALFELALRHPAIHALQHLMLFSVGWIFWWHVSGPIRPPRAAQGIAVLGFMSGTKVMTGVLASLITFMPFGGIFYDFYASQPRLWGLDATEDQQIAGALMMFEELLVMFTAVTFMFVRMLGEPDPADERYGPAA